MKNILNEWKQKEIRSSIEQEPTSCCHTQIYRYAAECNPSVMSCYQEMLLIPVKKEAEREIEFFSEKTLEAILTVPDVSSKKGRRDLVL